ncbi:MAG: hypothetical protein U5K33_02625 [Halofilum sp. (in: g-proteobacteria)]|nr:hypothetical protein [Halofilum sp. (in: g-proteobacteria)]
MAVDRVVLHGLALNLARDADGRGNWEDLVPADSGEAEPEPEPEPVPADTDANGSPGVRLRVEGIELRDANLAWRDAASGQRGDRARPGPRKPVALAPGEPTSGVAVGHPGAIGRALGCGGFCRPKRRWSRRFRGYGWPICESSSTHAVTCFRAVARLRRSAPTSTPIPGVGHRPGRSAAAAGRRRGRCARTAHRGHRRRDAHGSSGRHGAGRVQPAPNWPEALGVGLPSGLDDSALQRAGGTVSFSAAGETVACRRSAACAWMTPG